MSLVSNDLLMPRVAWKFPLTTWGWVTIALLLAVFIFRSGLAPMVGAWGDQGEYSYGYLIPFVCMYLIWQKKDLLEKLPLSGSWWGFGLVLAGVAFYVVGELSALYVIVQYAFLTVICGLALTLLGWRGFRFLVAPLFILFFMVPLPEFIFQGLSLQSQLISSQLGVAFIRMLGISVYLDGNVIDLGNYKLQVADACNGLRYLFPLMIVGFIMAYFFKVQMWKRITVFLSTIPLTIIMNSFRIGMIGVAVQYWGISAAEGILHEFEGWLVFMICTGVLAAEMWLLTRLSRDGRPLRAVFGLETPAPTTADANVLYRRLPRAFPLAVAVLGIGLILSLSLPTRAEIIPARNSFATFPLTMAEWSGQREPMSKVYIDALKFDDYVMADYTDGADNPVNFYVAYYDSQRKGASAHSPRSCIPGGGWQIVDLTQRPIAGSVIAGVPLTVNRVLIRKGDTSQLVYYWFQQRGRIITNEYLVKWYLFWDALTRNRTDGALVRVSTTVSRGEPITRADAELTRFVTEATPHLAGFIPGA